VSHIRKDVSGFSQIRPLPVAESRCLAEAGHLGVRRAFVAAIVTALALVTTADAHVTLVPPFIEAGAATTVSFETPNERRGRRTTSLEIVAPAGIELGESGPPVGWTLDLTGDRARWTGGAIRGVDVVSFPLVVTARVRPGTVTFTATQGYNDRQVVSWNAQLTVLPPSAEGTPPQHLRRALIAGFAGLVVIAGSFVALRRVR